MTTKGMTYINEFIADGQKASLSLKNFYDTILVGDVHNPDHIYRTPIGDFFTKYREQLIMAILKINNVLMPTPKAEGLTITEEKIWSKNTKRNNKGDTVGTIITIKTTMDITFPPLTYKQIKKIENEVSNLSKPFVPVYWNDGNGWEFTKTFYFASSPKPIYSTYDGTTKIIGYAISAVQK